MVRFLDQFSAKKLFLVSTVGGWLTLLLWMVVSFTTTKVAENCSVLSRFNLHDSRFSIVFLLTLVLFFTVSAYSIYSLFQTRESFNTRSVWSVVALAAVVAFCAVPFNTHDISFYFSSGKGVASGVNVYTESWTMINTFFCKPVGGPTIGIMYGPITVSFFGLMYAASEGSMVWFIVLWKIFILLGVVIGLYLLYKIVSPVKHEALLYLLWTQPVLLWHWISNGQFDIWWVVFVLFAILCAKRSIWWLAILSLFVGIWIKFIPLIISPWFVLWWWQTITKENWRLKVTEAAIGLGLSALLTYIVWRPYWIGTEVLTPIIMQTKWAVTSIFSVVYYSFKPLFVSLLAENAHWVLTRIVHGLVFTTAVYLLFPFLKRVRNVFLKRETWNVTDYSMAIFITLLVYLSVWQKSFWPWYISWILPFGFIVLMTRTTQYLQHILLWLSSAPFVFYVAWLINRITRHTDAASELWFYALIVAVMWTVPVTHLLRWRKRKYALE